jgi:hypothetical protein
MSRGHVTVAVLAGLIAGSFATSASAQTACTQPFDPACNHLKCYQIKDPASTIVSKSPVLRLDNQFGREVIYRLQPVMLCVPTLKACCNAGGCSPANCNANPVPAPPLPHFKCYKIKAKTCVDPLCAKVGAFPKGTLVNLRDQFGQELNVPVGQPRMICAPAIKEHVGATTTTSLPVQTTTTTVTTTTTSSTTTTLPCHFDPSSPTHCSGPCPAGTPPGSQCVQTAPGKCDCLQQPVCCECGAAGCFDINGQCPAGCFGVPGATCNPATGNCGCGYCRDAPSPSCILPLIPCDPNQPCPQGTICDPVNCPRECGGPCDQPAGQCSPDPCFRTDGTTGVCRPSPFDPCSCCGPPNAFCTTDFDCCSGICNVATNTCQ